MKERSHWDERYRTLNTPWDIGQHHDEMARMFARVPQGQSVLDVGCGLGTNARWLAQAGYQVTGVDLSGEAIEKAKQLAAQHDIQFFAMDFLQEWQKLPKFPVVFDCAVLQVFDQPSLREAFVRGMANVCEDQGYWINITCSRDQLDYISAQTGTSPPPSLTLYELVNLVEVEFEIIEINRCHFSINRGAGKTDFNAWGSLFKKRKK